MKQLSWMLVLVALLWACEKKKNTAEEEPPTPTTTGTPSADGPVLTVKVNDTVYACGALACASGYKSGSIRGISFGDQSAKKHLFRFTFLSMPAPGVYTFGTGGTASLQYVNNNTYYPVVTGSLSITEVDTTDRGVINRLVASFSATTDTTLKPPYSIYYIKEGIIKLK